MQPHFSQPGVEIYHGDALAVLRELPEASVHCCVTSPPYWGLRDYGVDGQLGLEPTPEEFVEKIVGVFREVRRVLRDDGTLWVNLGDSYAGHNLPGWRPGNEGKNHGNSNKNGVGYVDGCKPKDLVGIPWLVAFALRADGWYLRQDIIWHKPNPMPESIRDRCTKSHEYIFLLSKLARYYFDADAIAEPSTESSGWARQRAKGVNTWKYNDTDERLESTGQSVERSTLGHQGVRNKRSVWTVASEPYKGAHFATFPRKLIEPCILAGCPEGGVVLDPFSGSGTTGEVARKHGRRYVGIELNAEYIELSKARFRQPTLFGAGAQ